MMGGVEENDFSDHADLNVAAVLAITGGCQCWSCKVFVPRAVVGLAFISAEANDLRRSVRKATPTSRKECQRGFQLLEDAANHSLGRREP